MTQEEDIKKQILEKLHQGEHYKLYCCVCGEYLTTATYFQMYIVHFDCKDKEMIYYNVRPDRILQ